MSWLNVNLNESLSSIKGQLTNLASNVLAESSEDVPEPGSAHVSELRKLVSDQEIEIKRLQRENSDIAKRIKSSDLLDDWSWEVTESKSQTKTEAAQVLNDVELETKIRELEREKVELVQSLEQLDLDCQSTTDKLVAMKDELQTENSGLKLQHQDLAKENVFLKSTIEKDLKKMQLLEYEKASRDDEIQRLQDKIKLYMAQEDTSGEPGGDGRVNIEVFNKLESKVADYNKEIEIYERELNKLREGRCSEFSSIGGDSSSAAPMQQYIDILLNAMKNIDFNVERWSVDDESKVDSLRDYTDLVDNIVKGILDWKWKCEAMEEEMKNIAAEKELFITEKNNEIEKLLTNAAEMSNSLSAKSKELNHYEEECAQLSNNNDRLIAQLEETKQSDMTLHTIPEMNEHLDGQLEKCYKRIEQLEREVELRQNDKVDELRCQVVLLDKELDMSRETTGEWRGNFYQLDEENKNLKVYLENIRRRLSDVDRERIEREDRVTLDNEIMARQSLNLETMHEEIETLTASLIELRRDNTKFIAEKEELERKLEEAEKEIMDLKEEMTIEIETSLKKDEQMFGLNGTVDQMEQNILKLKNHVELLSGENEELVMSRSKYIMEYRHFKNDVEELILSYRDLKAFQVSDTVGMQELIKEKNILIERVRKMDDYLRENLELTSKFTALESKIDFLEEEKLQMQNEYDTVKLEKDKQIEELNSSRNEIIQLVQHKHQENIAYHGEIQRLQQLLTLESEKRKTFETQLAELNGSCVAPEDMLAKEKELEKLAEHGDFLRDKCAHLAEALLTEQSTNKELMAERGGHLEKEANLTRQLESLRQHLIEVEEMYTKEVQTAETKCSEMQQRMQTIVEKEKNSSTRFTSANIRANQQVETLQTNLQLVTNQRDELKRKMSDLEDQMEKQNAALCNLQIVLEQFQREKDKVIYDETERVRRQVTAEQKLQETLHITIQDLKGQLRESKEGLKAAVRLSDQVESSKRQVGFMKEEVAKLQQQLVKSEDKYNKLINQTDGRVDKMLIKNLVIGLVTCNAALNKDQNQILKIISTVLDFNQQDIEKVNLNKKDPHTWFSSLLHPQALSDRNLSSESLSQAFVKFLEAESKPRSLPNLLDATTTTVMSPTLHESASVGGSNSSSRKTSVRQSPLLLNEVVLPTFADFAANRNSSSILKDVLKDNTNVS